MRSVTVGEAVLYEGDALAVLPTIESGSVDVVLTDPPYPCIKRSYGTWTEAEWWTLMRAVVPQCMRVLKPTGSAVFILQPNSERVGRMRTWLWEFMTWVGKEWGIVQDAWWWNNSAFPEAHAIQGKLFRPSVKACVWVGPADCYRNQDAILLTPNNRMKDRVALQKRKTDHRSYPSGQQKNGLRVLLTSEQRGGVTPFNCMAFGGGSPPENRARAGHPAGTPLAVCDNWLRYLCPPGGVCLDPFMGSGTVPLAAMKLGCKAIGIERVPEYVEIARKRLAEAEAAPLFA